MYGFLQYQDGKLTSQLFSINNTSGGAPAAFRKFVSDSQSLGRGLGLTEIELQAGSVINPDLAKALSARGFQPKTVPVPDVLGGGTQEVLFKTVPIKHRWKMSEFAKYITLSSDGMEALSLYGIAEADGLDQFSCIKMLRFVCNLSIEDAKRIAFEGDTGESYESQEGKSLNGFQQVLDEELGID